MVPRVDYLDIVYAGLLGYRRRQCTVPMTRGWRGTCSALARVDQGRSILNASWRRSQDERWSAKEGQSYIRSEGPYCSQEQGHHQTCHLSGDRTIKETGGRKVTRAPGRLVRDGRTQEKSWYTPPRVEQDCYSGVEIRGCPGLGGSQMEGLRPQILIEMTTQTHEDQL